MKHVSSLGSPRVLLPTADVDRWTTELGDAPSPDAGLYGLACSIDDYCGVISPWGSPLLIFGDDPADIYYHPEEFDGLLFRWIGAESLDQLADFAIEQSDVDSWDETIAFNVIHPEMTLMDCCTFLGDTAARINLSLRLGAHSIRSRYAESPSVMTIIHRLDYVG